MENSKKKIVVSGMRPTGRLHLGNYWGALKNWVELQEKYDCFFFVADWHVLTTETGKTEAIRENARLIVIDWLTAGLDPERCVFFRQSEIKEHAELYLLMSMVTPVSWLLRNPTFKEQLLELHRQKYKGQEDKAKTAEGASKKLLEAHAGDEENLAATSELSTYGFLGYPVLQAADIVIYGADFVPVGRDQLPHLELSREIVRKFNRVFWPGLLKEPDALLTSAPLVPGLDGRKMSKSYNNSIELGEAPKSVEAKIKRMFTDPLKIKVDDKGHPEGCVVFAFHKIYNKDWSVREAQCRGGAIGCGACKKQLFELMSPELEAFAARRAAYEGNPGKVDEILSAGSAKARVIAAAALSRINTALKL